jgi:hypothetical protein
LTQQTKSTLVACYVRDTAVEIRPEERPDTEGVVLAPEQAAALGQSLLAASVVCHGGPPKPKPGTPIKDCHFPVEQWTTGTSNVNAEPVLVLRVAGGISLVFQFPKQSAQDCGRALQQTAIDLG